MTKSRKKKKKLWKGKQSLGENLRRRLPELARDYFAAGRVALAPGTTWDEMHQFRLATKRFRYTLESFRDAYGLGLNARIEKLRGVQTFLGDINDLVVTSAMIADQPEVVSALGTKAEVKTKIKRIAPSPNGSRMFLLAESISEARISPIDAKSAAKAEIIPIQRHGN